MRQFLLPALMSAIAFTAAAQTPPDVLHVEATLPDPREFGADPALELIEDHSVVLLDLTMGPEAYPSFEGEDGKYSMLEGDCDFGEIRGVRMMSVPTGSNHLVLDVRPGDSGQFAANSVTCEYMPSLRQGENLGQVITVRGCYLANQHSIPTAAHFVLNPLPPAACGLTQ